MELSLAVGSVHVTIAYGTPASVLTLTAVGTLVIVGASVSVNKIKFDDFQIIMYGNALPTPIETGKMW